MGSSVLGALLGRKAVSKTNVSRAATAAKAASRAAQQRGGAGQAAGSLESLRQKYTELQAKFQKEIENSMPRFGPRHWCSNLCPSVPEKPTSRLNGSS